MILYNIAPHSALVEYVNKFIIVQNYDQSVPSFKLVPRNFSVFFFTAPEMNPVENVIGNHSFPLEKGHIYFSGLGAEPAHMRIRENSHFIVALLNPAHTSMFLKVNAYTFTNHVQCVTYLNDDLRLLNEQLWNDNTSITMKISLLENYFFKLIHQLTGHTYVRRAIDAIQNTKGRIDVNTLAEKSWTCKRNLQRLFHQQVGVSPKQYISMVRFNNFMKEYIDSPHTNVEILSEKYEYFDLSHLNKTFIRYLGSSPTFSIIGDQTVNKVII